MALPSADASGCRSLGQDQPITSGLTPAFDGQAGCSDPPHDARSRPHPRRTRLGFEIEDLYGFRASTALGRRRRFQTVLRRSRSWGRRVPSAEGGMSLRRPSTTPLSSTPGCESCQHRTTTRRSVAPTAPSQGRLWRGSPDLHLFASPHRRHTLQTSRAQ